MPSIEMMAVDRRGISVPHGEDQTRDDEPTQEGCSGLGCSRIHQRLIEARRAVKDTRGNTRVTHLPGGVRIGRSDAATRRQRSKRRVSRARSTLPDHGRSQGTGERTADVPPGGNPPPDASTTTRRLLRRSARWSPSTSDLVSEIATRVSAHRPRARGREPVRLGAAGRAAPCRRRDGCRRRHAAPPRPTPRTQHALFCCARAMRDAGSQSTSLRPQQAGSRIGAIPHVGELEGVRVNEARPGHLLR